MAKKVPITKVLSCFVVFVILMSAVPVSTFASSTGDNVKFRGVVTGTSPEGLIGAITWYVSVDEWISGSLPCDEIDVAIGMYPPFGSWDENICKGDRVEVYGEGDGCTVGLNGESYYIKKIEEEKWDVKFQGTVTGTEDPHIEDFICEASVDKIISGADYIEEGWTVNIVLSAWESPCGTYEEVKKGDKIEVFGQRLPFYCWPPQISLCGRSSYYLKKMEVKTPVHNIDTGKDFATIQAAIDDSDTGHTITVDPGTYTENVDVTKSLTIKSTSGNPADTIVQAAVSNQNYQNVFTVTADNVHIDGFTIKGASYFWCSGILLDSNNCIISNNTFEGNAIGIWIHPPSLGNNIIRNNKFSSSSGYSPSTALYLEVANNKIYLNNFIIGMEWGSGNVLNSPTQITYEYGGNTFISHLGNYWDDYRDTDANGDGIWDHPYSIDEGIDYYPLVKGFEHYVPTTVETRTLVVNVYNVNGNPAAKVGGTTTVQLFKSGETSPIDEQTIDGESKATFTVPVGEYYFNVWHDPQMAQGDEEYWGQRKDVSVTTGTPTTIKFTRHTPYVETFFAEKTPVAPNTPVNVNVIVRVPSNCPFASEHVMAKIILRDEDGYEVYRAASSAREVQKGTSTTFSFSYTPTEGGKYYGFAKTYVGGGWDQCADNYGWTELITVQRYPTDLKEKACQHLRNTSQFYDNYSKTVLTYTWWKEKNEDAARVGIRDTAIWGLESIIYAPFTGYISGLNPWAAAALDARGWYGYIDFLMIDTVIQLIETYTLKAITEVLYNCDPKTLKTDLDNLNSNAGLLVSAFENGEEVSSLLSDRRKILANTYTDLCSYDQVAFYYFTHLPNDLSSYIDDYGMFHQHTSMLATFLSIDFILITACEEKCSGKSELNYNLAKEAGCGFVVQRLDDDFIKRAHFFGYFDAKGATDKYKLVMPGSFSSVRVHGDENIRFVLEDSDWIVDIKDGNGTMQNLEIDFPNTAGEYTLTVQCLKHAGPYEICIQRCFYPINSFNLYPKIEVLSTDGWSLKYLPDITTLALECPVNATITDQYGRIISDDGINEMPGADMFVTEDTKIFYLPADLTYSTEIDAYDTGTFNFTRVSPIGNDISITKFENIPVTASTKASVEIEPGVTDYTMSIDYNGDGTTDEVKRPDVSETIEVTTPTPVVFEDNFGELNLNKWIPFGSPSPRVLTSAEGRTGVFDNNGDGWCNSGVVSKDNFSFPNGCTMESDIYLDVTNVAGCWNSPVIGLTRQSKPTGEGVCPSESYPMGVIFGIEYNGDACWGTPEEKRRHAYFNIGLYTEDGTWESVSWLNADDYTDAWHNFKIAVGSDRIVEFYVDNEWIYTSEKRINETMLQEKKIFLGIRSSGSAGKSYHDYIKVYHEAVGPPSIEKVVFASDRSGNWDIWMMNPDGTDLEQLTTNPANDDLPQISAGGKKIVFCSDRTGTSQVWRMNSDGSDQVMGISLFSVVKALIKNKNPCWGLLCR